mgnify:FL=1
MKISEKAEEIMESLWAELVEKGKRSCNMTLLKDDAAFKELTKYNLVNVAEDKATLTEKGMEEARDCVRRHRLAERLVTDVFAIKTTQIHETGCAFEHLLHKGLDENVCTLLGHPRTCPHGRAIPEGRCCRETRKHVENLILKLSDMKPNEKAAVAYLQTDDKEVLQKLVAMGILPGTEITLLRRYPAVVFQTGKTQFAIDERLASRVHVRRA